jgi:hypothetical protein
LPKATPSAPGRLGVGEPPIDHTWIPWRRRSLLEQQADARPFTNDDQDALLGRFGAHDVESETVERRHARMERYDDSNSR